MMNHLVPDFHEMEGDYSIPTTSGSTRPKTGGEEIVELLWQNGQVVMQSQNQKQSKTAVGDGEVEREIRMGGEEQHQLFIQEDEMTSWLQYPLYDSTFDRDLYADLLYSAPPPPVPISTVTQPRVINEIRPPPAPPTAPPVSRAENDAPRLQNFVHFSRLPAKPTHQPPVTTARESTVVESNETPVVRPDPRVSQSAAESRPQVNAERGTATAGGTSATAGELTAGACELTVTSSPGGSRASFSASGEAHQKPAAEDRKRKARENDYTEYQSEDIEFEAAEAKKQTRGSTSTKRSRAAEVHNLSERRRRDRINEKMRALQELIPRCNKSDKASMLDEAIEYLKTLQMQVQMMSMGCPMVPMFYPGMQQYMPAMGLGIGMNRPVVPYPSTIPGPSMTNPANMGPRFPLSPAAFHIPQVHGPDLSRVQASNQMEPGPNFSHYKSQPGLPNFVDPYQQFLGMHQGQVPLSQNRAVLQPRDDKPSTSKGTGNPDNQQYG